MEEKAKRKEMKERRKNKTKQSLDKSDKPFEAFFDKKREAETEQLEQSCVTEAHSSDSSQNDSHKRKRHSSPNHDSHAESGGDNCVRDGPMKGTSDIIQALALQYENLFEDCFPTQIQDASLYPEDLDWLLQGRNQEARAEKKRRFGNESLSCSRSISGILWPRADYLREVDMYALPYTVLY
ncbi:hypothetical protein CASFOL_021395 [Castilleja foliolosa]|uniref:Uncharacterized protein n=1 Tax=Castilleja foliolosa TaxID=1961234 RepID=A0ABD3CWF1_9LAMI